jgi:NADH dehydrogenase FAD-containing subunit
VFDCHGAKRCSLLSSGSSLLPSLPPAAGRYAAHWLSVRGVNIVFHSSRSVAEIASSQAEAELLFDCTGLLPIPIPVLRPEQRQQQPEGRAGGRLSVTAALQSSAAAAEGRLFGIGDCAELEADAAACAGAALTRLAYTAEQQAAVAADNILSCMAADGDAQRPLAPFPSSLCGPGVAPPRIICCSLGSRDGLLCFNALLLSGPMAALAKWSIEWSKVRQYRGWHSAQLLWSAAERVVYAVNRAYRSIESRRAAAGSRERQRT